MRALLIAILLVLPLAAQETPLAVFAENGTWGEYARYSWSVCNGTSENVSIYGATIWSQGQRQGLCFLTNAQIEEYAAHYNKQSGWAMLRTAVQLASTTASGLQAMDALGSSDEWGRFQKAIAPSVALVTSVLGVVTDKHEEKLTKPNDYLPGSIQIPPGACEFGTLIGAQ